MNTLDPETVRMIVGYAAKFIGAIVTLVVGWILAAWAARLVRGWAGKTAKLELTLSLVLGKVVHVVIMAMTLIAVLNWFGVQTSSLVALVGAAGLTIGLALQGALSNVAAGVMLLVFRPFKVGDVIDFGQTGVVDEIGLFISRMHTPDNVAMAVPNSKIWGNVILNFAENPTRRVDMTFPVAYSDDMEKAVGIIREIIVSDPRCLKDPAPAVAVGDLGENGVMIHARPWVNRADFGDLKAAVIKRVKEEFDARGIRIAGPRREVHVYQKA